MQDKRCKYKIRECKDFYLFIKHKESHIYYAKFPEYNKIASTGISGNSVNNYISLLRKLWKNKEYNPFQNLSPMEHTKTIRQCFLVESFTGFGNFIKQHKYLLLPYLAITTGMRAGEFKTAEPVIIHNRLYLQINGSKSENAVRRVPITQKVADAYSEYKKNGFAKAAWKESVYMSEADVQHSVLEQFQHQ